MQKPLSFWRTEKFIYTRIHNLFCFVDLFIITSTMHPHIHTYAYTDCGESVWVCTSVPGNVYYVSQQSSWRSSAIVCVALCWVAEISCMCLSVDRETKVLRARQRQTDKYFYLTVVVGVIYSIHIYIQTCISVGKCCAADNNKRRSIEN